jgi:hypothetical protein
MPEHPVSKAKRHLIGIDIPRDELALRIAEQCIGLKAPAGTNAGDALDQMDREHPLPIAMGAGFRRAADAAVLLFHECIEAGRQPS